jgi:hypothetical protein
MPLRFFRRIPIVGRFVTLNLSKGNASVSVGIPGAHITHGTAGTRATVGLPGTGLFYTEKIAFPARMNPTMQRVSEWYAGLEHCNNQPFDATRYADALNAMKRYQITDADLPAPLLTHVEQIRTILRDDFGYRVEKDGPLTADRSHARNGRTTAVLGPRSSPPW